MLVEEPYIGLGIYDRARRRTRFLAKGERTALLDITWRPDGARIAWLEHPIRRVGVPAARLYTARPDGTGQRVAFRFPEDPILVDALDW